MLENLFAAVIAIRSATRIVLRSAGTKVNFLAQKLSNFVSELNKLMERKRVTDKGLEAEPPAAGRFLI